MQAILQSQTALIATGAAAVLVAGSALLMYKGTATSADESEAPVISLEETKDVMRKINAHVLESAVLVNQHALVICEALPQRKCQHMATQYAASVGMVAGPQVLSLVLPAFEQMIMEAQEAVFLEADVDEDEMVEACEQYKNDHAIADIVRCINLLYQTFGGELEEDLESDSPEKVDKEVRIAVLFMRKICTVVQDMRAEIANRVSQITSQHDIHNLLEHINQKSGSAAKAHFLREGIVASEEELSNIIVKYQAHPAMVAVQTELSELMNDLLGQR